MKIFSIDDMDWWIGADAESVWAAAVQEYGYTDEDIENFHELSDAELDALQYFDVDDEDERHIGDPRTFRAQLDIEIAAGGKFPRFFASEEH